MKKAFSNSLTEVYLLAIHPFSSVLTETNIRLQQSRPLIHKLHSECVDLVQTCIYRFCDEDDGAGAYLEDVASIDLENTPRLEGKLSLAM